MDHRFSRVIFEKKITAELRILDSGCFVLLTGGETRHVGAVSMARDGCLRGTEEFPGHREAVVAQKWAVALSRRMGYATVACGIHYDNADRAQIRKILETTDLLLADILGFLSK